MEWALIPKSEAIPPCLIAPDDIIYNPINDSLLWDLINPVTVAKADKVDVITLKGPQKGSRRDFAVCRKASDVITMPELGDQRVPPHGDSKYGCVAMEIAALCSLWGLTLLRGEHKEIPALNQSDSGLGLGGATEYQVLFSLRLRVRVSYNTSNHLKCLVWHQRSHALSCLTHLDVSIRKWKLYF